mmetsp:Transcript_17426/g.34769  ORF Transcript_17426/g.34769 Transcript_17426/m.34769 type:complete len:273 (-) Transcript_17426:318-1136(-)
MLFGVFTSFATIGLVSVGVTTADAAGETCADAFITDDAAAISDSAIDFCIGASTFRSIVLLFADCSVLLAACISPPLSFFVIVTSFSESSVDTCRNVDVSGNRSDCDFFGVDVVSFVKFVSTVKSIASLLVEAGSMTTSSKDSGCFLSFATASFGGVVRWRFFGNLLLLLSLASPLLLLIFLMLLSTSATAAAIFNPPFFNSLLLLFAAICLLFIAAIGSSSESLSGENMALNFSLSTGAFVSLLDPSTWRERCCWHFNDDGVRLFSALRFC